MTIEESLAGRLKRSAELAGRYIEERDFLIRQAAENGGSLREIAELVHLSHTGVRKIVQRGSAN